MTDSLTAFARGEAARAAGAKTRVFDWDKAAKSIKLAGASFASAGLSGDWEWTGGTIFAKGAIVPRNETYTYLASVWAIPELALSEFGGIGEPCWIWAEDSPGWDEATYWPESARLILTGNERSTT